MTERLGYKTFVMHVERVWDLLNFKVLKNDLAAPRFDQLDPSQRSDILRLVAGVHTSIEYGRGGNTPITPRIQEPPNPTYDGGGDEQIVVYSYVDQLGERVELETPAIAAAQMGNTYAMLHAGTTWSLAPEDILAWLTFEMPEEYRGDAA